MPRYTVLAVPGTTESHAGDVRGEPVGMLSFVTAELDPNIFACRNVGYPSAFGWPVSESESMRECLATLTDMIEATDLPVILLGYSQGAQVVRRLMGLLATGDPSVADLEIVGAGLLADPNRSPGVQDGPRLSGYGLAGIGPAWPADLHVWEIAQPRDPITNSPPGSLWRPFADVLQYFSVTNPVGWAEDVAQMILSGSGQHTVVDPWLIPESMRDLYAYAFDGQHQAYWHTSFPGTDRTYCQHLTDLINARFA